MAEIYRSSFLLEAPIEQEQALINTQEFFAGNYVNYLIVKDPDIDYVLTENIQSIEFKLLKPDEFAIEIVSNKILSVKERSALEEFLDKFINERLYEAYLLDSVSEMINEDGEVVHNSIKQLVYDLYL